MGYKPGDFLVGLIDFFAILLPGALLAFALKDLAVEHVFGPVLPAVGGETQGWLVFVFSSYLLGHFIFLLGSFIDDTFYDPYRKRFLTAGSDLTFDRAKEIKVRHIGDEKDKVVNPFKWAKANVQLLHPAASVEINRLEADSKFFRSLIVVLLLVSPLLAYKRAWIELAACAALVALSFFRYADQRFKSTQLAYVYLIALDKISERGPAPNRPAAGADAGDE